MPFIILGGHERTGGLLPTTTELRRKEGAHHVNPNLVEPLEMQKCNCVQRGEEDGTCHASGDQRHRPAMVDGGM